MTSFLIFLLCIHNDFDRITEYSGFVGRFLIAFIVTALISKDTFVKAYTNIIVYYSIISLIMYAIGFAFPSFILSLPISFNDAGTGYRQILFYFYQGIDLWNFRNAGIFWEAGAYQVFLSIALIFEVFLIKGSVFRILVLFVAIATTISSIGIVVLTIISFVLLFSIKSIFRYPLFILLALCIWLSGVFDALVLVKFYGNNISGIDRLSGQLADLQLFLRNPLFGVGVNEYNEAFKEVAYSLGAVQPTSSNSFTGMLALNGLLYSAVFFLPMLGFFFNIPIKFKEKVTMLLIFVLLLCSQGVMMQILFLCLSFYSFHHYTDSFSPIDFSRSKVRGSFA